MNADLSLITQQRDDARIQRLRQDLLLMQAARVRRPVQTFSPKRKVTSASQSGFSNVAVTSLNSSIHINNARSLSCTASAWPTLFSTDRPLGRDILNPVRRPKNPIVREPSIPYKSPEMHQLRIAEEALHEHSAVLSLPAIVSNNHGYDPAGSGVFDLSCLGPRPGRGMPRERSFTMLPPGYDDDD
eukprot:6201348-Pleurochrysis_carterae.AAC.2